MHQLRILLANIWQRRGVIVLSLIALPALFAMYGLNQKPAYTAVQTLSLKPENAQSNLLKNVDNPDFIRILARQLKNETLLKTALKDVGILLEGADPEKTRQDIRKLQQKLTLTAAGDDVIEITLAHPNRAEILRLLEAVVMNFIDDIMAPERFAKDELTNSLASQVQTIKTRRQETKQQLADIQETLADTSAQKQQKTLKQKISALEFRRQTLKMQQTLAENEYQKALHAAQENLFQPVIKPMSRPVIISTYGGTERGLLYGGLGFVLALLFSLLVVVVSSILDTSLRRDENIRRALGLRILGRMPHLGDVHFENGRISTVQHVNI